MGIQPRSIHGMKGIILSPLFHQNFKHLAANTPALLILGWFIYYSYKDIANETILLIWSGSGLLTWLIGRPAYHIGASGLIYGMAFFLFFSGIFRKNPQLTAIALLIVFIYGSLFWNMLPVAEWIDPNVSWEGHLSGALAGLLTAILLRKKGPQADQGPTLDEETDEGSQETEYKKETPNTVTDQTGTTSGVN